jgi:hypothetical protein
LLQVLARLHAGLARAGRRVERHRVLRGDLAQLEGQVGLGGLDRCLGAERGDLAFGLAGFAVGIGHLAVGADDLELGLDAGRGEQQRGAEGEREPCRRKGSVRGSEGERHGGLGERDRSGRRI